MRIIIKNGSVVTMNDAGDVVFDGAVVIDGDRITDVGPAAQVLARTSTDGAQVIDAAGKAVLPGLVDLHYHTALGKGWSDHLPLWEYLQTCWYPIIRALDYDAAYWAALASYSESVKCGVTTVNDMYRQLIALGDAAEEIGIRAVLSNDVASAEHNLDTLEDNKEAFQAKHGKANGRIEVYVGIEASRVDASLQQARDVVAMATRNGADALGHQTGRLEPGRKADVILVDLGSQMFTPLMPDNADHLFSHLVFAANGSCVNTTIIDGQIVMADRQLVTVDEQKILREANAAFRRVLDRMVVPGS